MDCSHCRARPHQWQKKMRRMQQINLVATEKTGQLYLLQDRVIFERRTNFLRVRCVDRCFAARRQNEQVFMLWRLGHNGFSQALHVTANAWIADSTQVKRNSHGKSRKMRPL